MYRRLVNFTPFPRDAIVLAIVFLNRITHLPYTTERDIHPTPLLNARPPRLPPRPPQPIHVDDADQEAKSPRSASSPVDGSRLSAPTSPIHAVSPLPPSPTISSVERPRATPFLNSYTLHRLLLTSLLIACKFSVDGTLSQVRAAKVGGVTPHELCKLEGEGLRLLGWRLMWTLDEVEDACREVERVGEQIGVLDPEQAERDAATPRPGASPASSSDTIPSSPTAGDLERPASPPRAGANAFYLSVKDTPPRRSSRERPSHLSRDPSSSASSSVPSSEASTSRSSSEQSSPLLALKPAGLSAFEQNLLPELRSSQREGRSRRGSRAAIQGERDEITPPSSPASETSIGEQTDFDEKSSDTGGDDLTRASSETIRRVEGMTVTG